MAEKKSRRTRRRTKAKRRSTLIKRITIALVIMLALLLISACALFIAVPRENLKSAVRDMLGEHLGAIRMLGAWNTNAEKAFDLKMKSAANWVKMLLRGLLNRISMADWFLL